MNITMGEALHQLRRQQGMTQSELGGALFSKSYISAVENDKVIPSYEAIHHFALQLGQHKDYFEQFLPLPKLSIASFSLPEASRMNLVLESALISLHFLEEGNELPAQHPLQEPFILPSDVLETVSKEKQTAYLFWAGYRARQHGDIAEALFTYELALTIAVGKYLPVILDEIGTCHALSSAYHLALNAHERALKLIEGTNGKHALSPLRLRIELHCAQDNGALGRHSEALAYYQHMRDQLHGHADLKKAAQIYSGLAYCTYASVFQRDQLMPLSHKETKIVFQQATECLERACMLYASGNERVDESSARLTLVRVLLDDCVYSQGGIDQYSIVPDMAEIERCFTTLAKAEEQCHQILTIEQEEHLLPGSMHDDARNRLLLLVASLLAIYVQRTILAHNDGRRNIATQAQTQAIWFCQQTLSSLARGTFSWAQLQKIIGTPTHRIPSVRTILPPLPLLDAPALQESQAELSLWLGLLAEYLAETATTDAAQHDFFLQADELFQHALTYWKVAHQQNSTDGTTWRRGYQYVTALLKARIKAHPAQAERHVRMLLELLSMPGSVHSGVHENS